MGALQLYTHRLPARQSLRPHHNVCRGHDRFTGRADHRIDTGAADAIGCDTAGEGRRGCSVRVRQIVLPPCLRWRPIRVTPKHVPALTIEIGVAEQHHRAICTSLLQLVHQ